LHHKCFLSNKWALWVADVEGYWNNKLSTITFYLQYSRTTENCMCFNKSYILEWFKWQFQYRQAPHQMAMKIWMAQPGCNQSMAGLQLHAFWVPKKLHVVTSRSCCNVRRNALIQEKIDKNDIYVIIKLFTKTLPLSIGTVKANQEHKI